jgi:hypothetical protein
VAKFGISFDDAMWQVPLAVINQLVIYDEMQDGRTVRWATSGESGARDLDALMAEALTGVG